MIAKSSRPPVVVGGTVTSVTFGDLADIERYYDAVPRPVATTEEVGPFTLFLAARGHGWSSTPGRGWG